MSNTGEDVSIISSRLTHNILPSHLRKEIHSNHDLQTRSSEESEQEAP